MHRILCQIFEELRRSDALQDETPEWYRKGNTLLAHAMVAVFVNVLAAWIFGPLPVWSGLIQAAVYFASKEISDLFETEGEGLPDSVMDTIGVLLGAYLALNMLEQDHFGSALYALALGAAWFSYPYQALK